MLLHHRTCTPGVRHICLLIASVVVGIMCDLAPAQAQATRTWVSGLGDDINPCSRTSPCKTFAGAISKTAAGGEINCLDPGGFGAVTITKSVTIDCSAVFGSILHAGSTGVIINFDSMEGQDKWKAVRLHGLSISGGGSGRIGIRILGTKPAAVGSVVIENCVIDGSYDDVASGVFDERSAGGRLFILSTTVRNMGVTGISISPADATNSQAMDVVLDATRILNAKIGLLIGGRSKVMVVRTVVSGHSEAGVDVSGAAAEVQVSDSVLTHNQIGARIVAGVKLYISNSDIAFNATTFSGKPISFGNNRILGDGPGDVTSAKLR